MGSLSLRLLRNTVLNPIGRRRCETAAVWSPISGGLRQHERYRSNSSLAAPKFPILMFPGGETVQKEEEIKKKLIKFRTFCPMSKEFMYPSAAVTEEISNSYCAGSSRGWLAFVSRIDCQIYLADLFSSPTFVPLPNIDTLPHVNNVNHCSKKLKCKPFEVHNRITGIFRYYDAAMMSERTIWKMAISSNPTDTDCIVMISCGPVGDLAYCRIGDTSWTVLESLPGRNGFTDLIYCQKDKLFYAITDCFSVEAFDLITNPSSPRRFDCPYKYPLGGVSEYGLEIFEKCFDSRAYLVESPQGDILVICRHLAKVAEDGSLLGRVDDGDGDSYRSVYFQVFKLDLQNQTGRHVDDLDDTALFLGLNQSFSLSVRDYPQLSPNSIYFADDMLSVNYDCLDYPYGGGHDFGVYNHNDESVSPLYQPFQFIKFMSPPLWVSRA